jgi:beta-glucosidase/6-phospho-beta-glucosidase/beta-galactosidase
VWLERRGGVHGKEFVPRFTDYARFVIDGIGDLCDWWHTTNEPVGFCVTAYIAGLHPPGKRSFPEIADVLAHLAEAHAIGYDLIHAKNPKAKVSFAKNVVPFVPVHQWGLLESAEAWLFNVYNRLGFDIFETETIRLFTHTRTVKGIKGKLDFISLNHYYVVFTTLFPSEWGKLNNQTVVSLTYGDTKYNTSDFGWGLVASSLADSAR